MPKSIQSALTLVLITTAALSAWSGCSSPPPTPTPAPTAVVAATATATVAPSPTRCVAQRPPGWNRYIVQAGDTLLDLAAARNTDVASIVAANCLETPDMIIAGDILYLPALPTPTPTPTFTPTPTLTPSPTVPPTIAPPPADSPPPPAALAATATRPRQTPTPAVVAFNTPAAAPLGPEVNVGGPDTGGGAGVSPRLDGGSEQPDAGVEAETETPPRIIDLPEMAIFGGLPRPNVTDTATIDLRTRLDRLLRFQPCNRSITSTVKYIDHLQLDPKIELGTRQHFYTCNFTRPVSPTITHPRGFVEPLHLRPKLANPDIISVAPPQQHLDWAILPSYQTGVYTVTVIDRVQPAVQEAVTLTVTITSPTRPNIVIVPDRRPDSYLVYYTNFTPTVRHYFGIFREVGEPRVGRPGQASQRLMSLQKSYSVTMSAIIPSTGLGWGRNRLLITPTTYLTAAYGIAYELEPGPQTHRIRYPDWYFWLTPP